MVPRKLRRPRRPRHGDAPSTSHSGLGKSRLRSRGRGFSWLQTVASSVSRASGTKQGLRDPIRTQRRSTSHVQHQFVCARRQSAPSYFCLSDGSPRNNRVDREASRFLRPRIPCDLTSSTTPTCPCPQLQVLRLQLGPHSSPSHKSQAAAKTARHRHLITSFERSVKATLPPNV